MIKLLGIIIDIFLICIVILQVPQESLGLASFATKNEFLDSSLSSEQRLNLLTGLGVMIYFLVATRLNLITV